MVVGSVLILFLLDPLFFDLAPAFVGEIEVLVEEPEGIFTVNILLEYAPGTNIPPNNKQPHDH